jgi:hypothetical protein
MKTNTLGVGFIFYPQIGLKKNQGDRRKSNISFDQSS